MALVSVEERDQDHEQKLPEPGEDEAEVVADGGEDGVGRIAVLAPRLPRNSPARADASTLLWDSTSACRGVIEGEI